MGQELGIIVRFDESGGVLKGTIDIPMQLAADLPLSSLKREGERVHFELAAGPGVAVFDGILKQGNLAGDFFQAGIKGSFKLLKAGEKALKPAAVPQPAVPLPYRVEEVKLKNGEISLAGTLTLPEGKGPFPAVVMITGSGTQNRDEEVFGFKVFGVIADHLTRKGIAVLRCDDRGLGSPQAAMDATSRDFALDAAAQARYLLTRDEIARDRIGLFGHSEGAIIAPLADQIRPCDFMVLMAGTAVNGREVLLEQIALIARADGAEEAEIAAAVASQKRAYVLLERPDGEKEIEKMIAGQVRDSLAKMTPEQRQAVADPEAYVRSATAAQIAALRSPWFRHFLDFDPAPALEMVKCPVLALFGERDTQVSPKQNMPAMEKAFRKGGNRDVTFKVFPEANHLFQKAVTGSPSEYASLEKAFVPGFLDTISSWILEKTHGENK
jgi:Dipeptidyl aminopeptidases/acylaminoacyl-peptidases